MGVNRIGKDSFRIALCVDRDWRDEDDLDELIAYLQTYRQQHPRPEQNPLAPGAEKFETL
jgi:hypothetical protein